MTHVRRIVLLGGYGNTGQRIAQLLAPRADVQLVVAGRSRDKAQAAAQSLAHVAAHSVEAAAIDATHAPARRALFDGASLVIAASSTSMHAAEIAEDAIAAGADAYDTNLSLPRKHEALRALAPEVERRGLTIITDGGFHPGLPGAMARHAASLVPDLEAVRIGGAFNIDWNAYTFSEATIGEFVEELATIGPEAYEDGRWIRSWSATRLIDFGGHIGERQCVPWGMEEVRQLPAIMPSLKTAGFFIAGFGRLVDYAAMPAALLAFKIAPSQKDRIGRAFLWTLRHWTPRGEWAVLLLDGIGAAGRHVRIRVSHDNGYDLTAFPVVAGVEQLLDGPRRPGVFTQGHFVDPAVFLRRLESLGVTVQISAR
jgi:saccharopine dehydrogenase (NAD+, L-lysine-forming)